MFDQKIYEALEKELEKHHIIEEVDEILLDFAEAIADKEIMDKDLVLTESYEKTTIEVLGSSMEAEGEVNVFIKKLIIGNKEFEINDYFL